jgi:hypothetical protein
MQPTPKPNDCAAIADLVIADIQDRKRVGVERYGVALQAHNGRDALLDAYEESLDQTKYLKQALVERADHRAEGAAEELASVAAYLRKEAAILWGPQAAALIGAAANIENGHHRRGK